MRALVTGGAGFVGSHLTEGLVAQGNAVLVVDNLSRGHVANLDVALRRGVKLVHQDVRASNAMRDIVQWFHPDVVFHTAALVDVRASMTDPVGDAHRNVIGAVSVLAAAAEAGVRRLVLSSTDGAIYGEAAQVPTPETTPADPMSAYGLAKWVGERYGRWFSDARGIDVVALRYSNVYGPRQEFSGESGVVARFCVAALEGRPAVVYGDGLQSRDFVFVDDVVKANIAVVQCGGHEFDEYNVGYRSRGDRHGHVGYHPFRRRLGTESVAPEFRLRTRGRGSAKLSGRHSRSTRANPRCHDNTAERY